MQFRLKMNLKTKTIWVQLKFYLQVNFNMQQVEKQKNKTRLQKEFSSELLVSIRPHPNKYNQTYNKWKIYILFNFLQPGQLNSLIYTVCLLTAAVKKNYT